MIPWVDCAEHVECISPKGAKRGPCNWKLKPDYLYVGCHRYDQSALNVLLMREFGPSLPDIIKNKGNQLDIQRSPTGTVIYMSARKKCAIL